MDCDDDILNYLDYLDDRDILQEGYEQFELFVCQLYTSKVYTKVDDFRWFLYSNRADEGESSNNDWLTNTRYSTSTLHSNDLEKGWGKTSAPPFSGRMWLGV